MPGVRIFTGSLIAGLLLLTNSGSGFAAGDISVLALFKDKALVSIDGRRQVLRVGQTSREGVKLIRASSKKAVLEVDGKRSEYRLGQRISGSFKKPANRSVQIFRDNGGMFTTVGSINNQMVDFLVDTGASMVAMSSLHAKRLGINFRVKGLRVQVNTASGRADAFQVSLRAVSVGDIRLQNVDALVIEGDAPHKILLGMSFLNRVRMKNDGQALTLITK